jgi:hypothetical protein
VPAACAGSNIKVNFGGVKKWGEGGKGKKRRR